MITSTSNTQIKNVINLIKKSKDRKAQGLFVVEGKRMFEETPKERIHSLFVSESFERANKDSLRGYAYELVADDVFSHMSDTKTPQGVMALVKMSEYSIEDMLKGGNPLIMILENLQDPGNLGTILRMGEGAGVTGVVMSSNTVDIYNPKTIRSTMGSIFRVPFVYVQDFSDAVSQCQNAGIKVYAAHLDGKNTYLGEDYREGTAFLIGNEGNGLTDDITKQADILIRIPMQGEVESLNAAIACTILTYEAVRQRSV